MDWVADALIHSCFIFRQPNRFLVPVAGRGAPTCEGLAVDWVGNNLYWTDNAFNCIFIASLSNLSLVRKAICDNLTHPKSIALDPENGSVEAVCPSKWFVILTCTVAALI